MTIDDDGAECCVAIILCSIGAASGAFIFIVALGSTGTKTAE